MKLDILIVDLAMVAAVFLPYLLFIFIGRKEIRKLKSKFSEEAKKYQLRIEERKNWNNNIIGLDNEKSKILLVQKRRIGFASDLIDLKEVRSCALLKEVHTVKIEQRTEEILQRLDLQLKLFNGNFQTVNLYNCEESCTQDYELRNAERWINIINRHIVFRSRIGSAA